ncbi:DUF3800 domain-containing protein [Macrococcoides goetzii]|uniref:DUF3800 domain-containing protein n=1 Tax=Macrococcus sp. PK TaxID=2801919 RepID=UPI001F0EFF41|nr:DUF3800 domain-containing protein [Macrococcus sp. PK]MCH4985340.1 DUF3800 domain-containing protein [Macrococcus sp. PK]
MHLTFYGDESGSISCHKHFTCRYFFIGMISTNNTKKVKRVFRKAKKDFINNNEVELDYTTEIKGSDMPLEMKIDLINELIKKTDIKFYYIAIDNFYLSERLQKNPHVTYNYMMGIFFKDNFLSSLKSIHLILDERNKSVKKLKDLEHYLQTELIVETEIEQVKVDYEDSAKYDLIQVADIFNNLLYNYGTFYMNARKEDAINIRNHYLELFNNMKPRFIARTNFPQSKSMFRHPF